MPLASLFSLIGNVGSGILNAHLQRQQNQHNEDLARLQNELRRNQWLQEMSYNSPSQQVKRLREAGINPALAYTNGIENLAPASPEMMTSQGTAPSIGSPFANLARDMQQDKLVDSQVKLNESAAKRNLADAGLKESQTELNGVKITYTGELMQSQISVLNKTTEKMDVECKKLFSDIDVNKTIAELNKVKMDEITYKIEKLYPAQVDELAAKANLEKAQAKEIYALLSYKMMLYAAQSDYYNAAAYNQLQQGDLAKAQATFQNLLNTSDGYVQNIVDGLEYDTETKRFKMNLTEGTSPFAEGNNGSFIYTFSQAINGAMAMAGQLFTGVYRTHD